MNVAASPDPHGPRRPHHPLSRLLLHRHVRGLLGHLRHPGPRRLHRTPAARLRHPQRESAHPLASAHHVLIPRRASVPASESRMATPARSRSPTSDASSSSASAGVAASNYFYYLAIQRTNVATAIIVQYTAPVWVLVYMAARGLEKATVLRKSPPSFSPSPASPWSLDCSGASSAGCPATAARISTPSASSPL